MKFVIALLFLMSGNVFAEKKETIDSKTIREIMLQNQKRFQKCYDESKKEDSIYSTFDAKFDLIWNIDSNGLAVGNSEVTNSNTANPKIHACVLGVLTKLKFPAEKNRKITQVIYTLTLSKEGK